MNPGDKVRVTRRGVLYNKEGIFVGWHKKSPSADRTCNVKFGEGLGNLLVDAWDLELVTDPPVKCDTHTTTGRRFKAEHVCTLLPEHHGDHLCNICGHSWLNMNRIQASKRMNDEPIGLAIIYPVANTVEENIVDTITRRKMELEEGNNEGR